MLTQTPALILLLGRAERTLGWMMKSNASMLEPYEILRYARPFPRLPIPLIIKASIIPVFTYIVFLSLSALTGKATTILNSPMHLTQISFSICIYLGIISASVVNSRFNSTFRQSRHYFKINDKEYRDFLLRLTKKINSFGGFIFSLPLMICSSIYFFLGVFPDIPDAIFPVSATSLVLIYVTIIEFSIGMLFLLGNVGFWFCYCITKAFRELQDIPLQIPALPTKRFLHELSDLVILFTVLLLIIISSVYPTTLFILTNHSGGGQALWIGGIGLGSVLVLDIIFFVIPQLGIHGILVNGKEQLISTLSSQYSIRDTVILDKLNIVKQQGCSDELLRDIEILIKSNAYLIERVQFVQTSIKDWAFDLGSIASVLSSSLVPMVTFVIQVLQEI